MGNWKKALFGALVFFIIVGPYVSGVESGDALAAGESMGAIIWPVMLVILGIYFAYSIIKGKTKKHK